MILSLSRVGIGGRSAVPRAEMRVLRGWGSR